MDAPRSRRAEAQQTRRVSPGGAHLCRLPAGRVFDQFRYGFASAVSEDEARELYDTYAVPASGAPLFQAAAANLNPWTEVKVDTEKPDRGPLLIISGEKDHPGVTEIVEMPNRGHALTIDSGWREVCQKALAFVKRFTQ
jgi:non-heme chloroperoxidase